MVYEQGGPDEDSFLAVYYADEEPVAVLGWNQAKQFLRWRKTLEKLAAARTAAAGLAAAAAARDPRHRPPPEPFPASTTHSVHRFVPHTKGV